MVRNVLGAFLLATVLLTDVPATAQTATPTVPPICCQVEDVRTSQMDNPIDVKIHGGYLYVANAFQARIEVFPVGSSVPVTHFSAPGMNSPFGMALDGMGHLYVTDKGASRIWKFRLPSGTLVDSISNGSQPVTGNLAYVTGIWANNAGTTLFVAEESDNVTNGQVRIFSQSGTYTALAEVTFPPQAGLISPAAVWGDDQGALYVTDAWNDTIYRYSGGDFSNGTDLGLGGYFFEPRFITADWTGKFYVTDQGAERYAVFNPDWSFDRFCDVHPVLGGGQVQGIVVDLDGRIYLGDNYDDRIVVHAPCSNFVAVTPTPPVYLGTAPPGPEEAFLYPSPVRGTTANVSFRMASQGQVQVRVWNAIGELVKEVSGDRPAGVQTLPLDLAGVANGVHFFSVTLQYLSGEKQRLPPGKFLILR